MSCFFAHYVFFNLILWHTLARITILVLFHTVSEKMADTWFVYKLFSRFSVANISMNRSSFSNSKSQILMSSLYIKSACENLVIFTRTQNYIATSIDPRSTCRSPLGRHVDRYMIDTRPTTGDSRSSVDRIMCRAIVCC